MHREDDFREQSDRRDKKAKKAKREKSKRNKDATDKNISTNGLVNTFTSGDLLGIGGPIVTSDSDVTIPAVGSSAMLNHKKTARLWYSLEVPKLSDIIILYAFDSYDRQNATATAQLCLYNTHTPNSGCSISALARFETSANAIKFDSIRPESGAISDKIGLNMQHLSTSRPTLQTACALEVNLEHMLGAPDKVSTRISMDIPLSLMFVPLVVSESEFESLISSRGKSKGCVVFSSVSDDIIVTSFMGGGEISGKSVLKAMASLVNGHVVNREGSKAVTICSSMGNSDIICILVKVRSGASENRCQLKVAVKYMSSDDSVDIDQRSFQLISVMKRLVIS